MSSERRDRFLKLERARPDGADAPEPFPDDARFAGLGDPPGTAPVADEPRPSVPSSSTDRFRPPPERPLETAEGRDGAQPFTRCASCQMDNTIYAASCVNCGAALDTVAQHTFNERLWAERQAQAEEERRISSERERARQAEAAELARKRREIGEALARREKERTDDQYPEGPLGTGRFARPDTVGMRLLRQIPGTGWRVVAAAVVFGIPLLLLLLGRGRPQIFGLALLGVLVALFAPPRRRDRRW